MGRQEYVGEPDDEQPIHDGESIYPGYDAGGWKDPV